MPTSSSDRSVTSDIHGLPARRTTEATAALWLAGALIALPWTYRVYWDTPRTAPLVLLAPALWFGRAAIGRAFAVVGCARRGTLTTAAVLVASTVLATALSSHWAASLTMAASWILMALTAVLVSRLIVEVRSASVWLLGALAMSSATATLAHWIRWQQGLPPETAFYVHHRFIGLHALSGALASVAMVMHSWERPALHRAGWALMGMLSWAGMLWSGSRSPLLGVGAGMLVWAAQLRWRDRLRLATASTGLCVVGLALSTAAWTNTPHLGWWNLWQRTAAVQTTAELTSNRSDFWAASLEHIRGAPWVGHGPDAYGFLIPQLEGAQPHNLVLQLALDLGAPGALAALVLLGTCLWVGWRNGRADAAATPWEALAVGFVVASLFDGYFYYTLAALPALIALGACARPRGAETAPPRASTPVAWAMARAWPLGAGGAAAVLAAHSLLYHRAVHGSFPESPTNFVARAWRAFPSTTFNVDEWIDRWAVRFPDEALAVSRHAIPHAQTPELFRVRIAGLLARRGDHAGAIAELERARFEARPEQHAAIDVLLARARAAAAR